MKIKLITLVCYILLPKILDEFSFCCEYRTLGTLLTVPDVSGATNVPGRDEALLLHLLIAQCTLN